MWVLWSCICFLIPGSTNVKNGLNHCLLFKGETEDQEIEKQSERNRKIFLKKKKSRKKCSQTLVEFAISGFLGYWKGWELFVLFTDTHKLFVIRRTFVHEFKATNILSTWCNVSLRLDIVEMQKSNPTQPTNPPYMDKKAMETYGVGNKEYVPLKHFY